MTYEVVVLPRAKQDMRDSAAWWKENRSTDEASVWLNGIEEALKGLSQHPARCPLARENREFPFEVRHLLYGVSAKPTHRAIFTIDEEAGKVLIHAVRHVAQATLLPDDI